jgi:hypothetical protein
MTIYKDGTSSGIDNILGFISKGNQDSEYRVGSSGLKKNWFIWNKGIQNDAEGNTLLASGEGVFGIDMEGKLFATAGTIGNWNIGTNSLYNTNLYLYGHVELESDNIIEVYGNKTEIQNISFAS